MLMTARISSENTKKLQSHQRKQCDNLFQYKHYLSIGKAHKKETISHLNNHHLLQLRNNETLIYHNALKNNIYPLLL